MLTIEQRKKLGNFPPKDCIGWDCEGQKIKPGDKVEVIKEEDERKGDSEYEYASVGKQGKVVRHFGGWIVHIMFKTKSGSKILGCFDGNLRKI